MDVLRLPFSYAHCSCVYCSVLQEARLRDIMDDLHLSFKQRVKASRGARLTGRDEELFSGKRGPASYLPFILLPVLVLWERLRRVGSRAGASCRAQLSAATLPCPACLQGGRGRGGRRWG